MAVNLPIKPLLASKTQMLQGWACTQEGESETDKVTVTSPVSLSTLIAISISDMESRLK